MKVVAYLSLLEDNIKHGNCDDAYCVTDIFSH